MSVAYTLAAIDRIRDALSQGTHPLIICREFGWSADMLSRLGKRHNLRLPQDWPPPAPIEEPRHQTFTPPPPPPSGEQLRAHLSLQQDTFAEVCLIASRRQEPRSKVVTEIIIEALLEDALDYGINAQVAPLAMRPARVALNLTNSLHKQLAEIADRRGESLGASASAIVEGYITRRTNR